VNGTKTALPSTRPTPFPPNAISSICSSNSRSISEVCRATALRRCRKRF